MTVDVLRQILAERHIRVVDGPALPSTCPRCDGIFEAPLRDEAGAVKIPGHAAGDPRTCIPGANPTGSARDARVRKAARDRR